MTKNIFTASHSYLSISFYATEQDCNANNINKAIVNWYTRNGCLGKLLHGCNNGNILAHEKPC